MDPSGTFVQCDARAIGSASEGAQSSLQEVYHKVQTAASLYLTGTLAKHIGMFKSLWVGKSFFKDLMEFIFYRIFAIYIGLHLKKSKRIQITRIEELLFVPLPF